MNIGIFDSGYGGLTVYKEIVKLLPQYNYVYLGDNARAPYGDLPLETITEYTWEAVRYLFSQDCQLVILACNTASANALRTIQQRYLPAEFPDNRVLGVIRPSIEALAELPAESNVAIWGTTATIISDSYGIEAAKYAPHIHIFQLACPLLAQLIESSDLRSEQIKAAIASYWNKTTASMPRVDALLLACTHYPLIETKISAIVDTPKIISQGKIVAAKLDDYLQRHSDIRKQLGTEGQRSLLTTGNYKKFDAMAELFLGQKTKSERIVL